MKETWKNICFVDKGVKYNYKNKYQVSDQGRIRSMNYRHTGETRVMKPVYDTDGYQRIMLYKNGVGTMFKVHRLVAIHFIPNPENKPEVNHKHGIKDDNRASELEWNTTSENQKHAFDTGLHKHYTRKVLQYDLQGNFIRKWNSIKEASEKLCIKHSNSIVQCCNGKYKSAGNYIWKYTDTR